MQIKTICFIWPSLSLVVMTQNEFVVDWIKFRGKGQKGLCPFFEEFMQWFWKKCGVFFGHFWNRFWNVLMPTPLKKFYTANIFDLCPSTAVSWEPGYFDEWEWLSLLIEVTPYWFVDSVWLPLEGHIVPLDFNFVHFAVW